MTKLTLGDIADVRAYEREREEFRTHVIALKKRRRIHVGPVLTFVFENRDTMRFQIQEMARVEKLVTDEAIRHELDTYNPLIPDAGQLCATMFIELTHEMEMHEWLPKLVGIERSIELRVSQPPAGRADPRDEDRGGLQAISGPPAGRADARDEDRGGLQAMTDGISVPCVVDEAHERMLTREDVTAAVHYLRFELTPSEIAACAAGTVTLASTHHQYREATTLSEETRAELLADLRADR